MIRTHTNNMQTNKTNYMKKIALIFTVMLGAFAMNAQNEAKSDTARFPLGEVEILVVSKPDTTNDNSVDSLSNVIEEPEGPSKNDLTHWGGLDLGVNFLVNSDNKMKYPANDEWIELDHGKSLSWRFNFVEQKIRIAKDYAGIITGVSLVYNSYTFDRNVALYSNPDSTFAVLDTVAQYSKNKLRATYLQVPLLLEFNTSGDPDKTFHLAAGIVGGVRIGSKYKQKFESDGKNYRAKVSDDYNLSPLTLDATARIGYRNLTLFATYGLTSLFKDDKGPEVYPVTVGLSLVPFR
jgi:Outer membrane protein beta-barrel domain